MKVTCCVFAQKCHPAYEMMETDPDWAPSLHLGHTEISHTNTTRSARRSKREQRKNTLQPAEGGGERHTEETHKADEDAVPHAEETQATGDGERHTEEETHNTQGMAVTQTECNLCVHRGAEVNRLLEENRQLRRELDEHRMSDSFFGDNDDKVKYYTGLPNMGTFMALLSFLVPLMSDQKRKVLSPFQMLLLTFMRLRLDLPAQHLAHLFRVSPKTVYRTFQEIVSFMYANLSRSIIWPDRDTLQKIMPHQFVESFGRRVAVIIDCFEIFTEKPSNLKARAQMFSSYKHNHTMKYLIGITPKGSICFISKGWGGRTSDKHITENSGFLEKLLPGDIVLADRGFDIKESVGMLCAEVKLPAFTKGYCQLAARDVEETRKVAHLRIHVERVIGNICQKYNILTGTIPINMILPCEGEDITFLDKIVTVCCALTNQCPTVV
uniref:DDE Tnp4 domain-containing protein n=1 Tax=Cyprinus carpio TaxID=7962 RepID=A0A8C1SN24_CYPCA